MKNYLFILNKSDPKYKQIYDRFKSFIEQGDMLTDEQLPSIRQLADSLQVSRNTTLTAYSQLVAEGYIRGEGRKGYFVNPLEPSLYQEQSIPSNKKKVKKEAPIHVNFRTDAVDQSYFPLKIWRRIANQILTLPESFRYGEAFGEVSLREQIATYLLQARGVKTDAAAIVIGSSTQQLLIHLGHMLQEEYSSIIVEDPGFDGAREAFQFHHFTLEYLPVYVAGADLAKLKQMESALIYVTPSHHSPYGVSMSIQQRQTLVQWANKVQGYIIEDDYDSEFRYTQRPFPALASLDSTRVIYLGNFSKSFLPGLRLSYMVLPQQLLNNYKNQFRNFESSTSLFSQLTMARFMENGEWNRHMKRMRLVYKRKMKYLVSLLKKHFEEKISIIGEKSGLYVLIKVYLGHSEAWLIEQAFVYGVMVRSTSIYFVKNHSDQPIIKLGFSSLTFEEIELGVNLLKKAWL